MNLDDLYFKDNFTKDGDKVDLEISKLTTSCITSKNNRFNLDVNGNLSVNSITTEVPIVTESQIDVLYPVGSIYMNVNPINPNVVLGGSWEQIKDRFLLACGNSFANGTTGGEASHILSINEMPNHNHTVVGNGNHQHNYYMQPDWRTQTIKDGSSTTISDSTGNGSNLKQTFNTSWGGEHSHNINATGGNQAHNNMPPYLAIYVWKRVS